MKNYLQNQIYLNQIWDSRISHLYVIVQLVIWLKDKSIKCLIVPTFEESEEYICLGLSFYSEHFWLIWGIASRSYVTPAVRAHHYICLL